MKVLVQLQNDQSDEQNKIINRSEIIYDSENFITSIVEVENIENQEGEYLAFEWDKSAQKVVAVAKPVPKSENEMLKEEIEMLKGSIVDLTMLTLGE